jgi:ABC-type bacteriocin/lantibiotic exporter with double-glycine peptidase domain
MIACIITQILLSTYVSRQEVESELDMKNRLRHRLFSHMMDSRWASGAKMHTGDVMNRIWEDVDNIANTVCVVVPQTAVTCIQFVAAVTFLAILDYRLAMIVVLILPTFILLSRVYARRIRTYTKEIRDIDSRVQAHIQENMHHRTLVSSMEYTPCVVEDLQTMQANLREKVMRRTDFTLLSRKMMQLGFSAGYLSAFVWGTFRLKAGAGYGMMTAFMQLAGQVQRPIMELSRQLPSFIHVTTAVDRLAELYDMPLEERGAVRLEGELGVRVENVTFAYKEGENVLENFSYDFAAGRMTAILGHTGAGKSTLLRLILGLIDPQQGRALIYNSEREESLSSRTRCNLGYVPQGNSLMSGTIRSNLLLGNPSATDEQMCKALHTAVADFVFDLPLGLDTPCSESGMGLSEGQAQRIAIARALLRDRSVMLMDEPTAALDTATEALLLQRLSSYASGRTMIIVTHHPSAAELCDAVVRVE